MVVDVKIVDGAVVLSIGIELIEDNRDIDFEKFEIALTNGKKFIPLDEEYIIKAYKNLKGGYNIDIKNIKNEIQEYSLNEDLDLNKKFDPYLLLLFFRKHILTKKGREGFYHIKFYDKKLDFYEWNSTEPATFEIKGDIVEIHEENKKSDITCRIVNDVNKKINVKGYLHIDVTSTEKGKKVGRIASVTFVMEPPKPTKDNLTDKNFISKNNDYLRKFFSKIENYYISLPENFEVNVKDHEDGTKDIEEEFFRRFIKEDEQNRKFISLVIYLYSIIWNEIIYKLRDSLKLKKDFINPVNFIIKNISSWEFISFKSIIFIVDKIDENSVVNKMDWLYFVSDFFHNFKGYKKTALVVKMLEDVYISSQFTFIFKNSLVALTDLANYPMLDYYSNMFKLKSGKLWTVTWYIMLSDMATTTAMQFISYNEAIEKHTTEKKSVRELKEITQNAINDFEDYYDIDTVNSAYYKEEVEAIKEKFGLNKYHQTLVDRLQLFSNYEIAEETKITSNLIAVLTYVLAFLTLFELWLMGRINLLYFVSGSLALIFVIVFYLKLRAFKFLFRKIF
ncbi:MAG: hypothetical protein ACP5IB_06215 [Thermoplasmata archaeon]